jgi:geranylgeranyl reductase
MNDDRLLDVIVVGGGPAGATAATDLATAGRDVALIDREGRIKPCGGAIPPRAIRDFDIPANQLVARATGARMIAPSGKSVDMPIDSGFVGMVDRDRFDPWLRDRAAAAGAMRVTGQVDAVEYLADGTLTVAVTTAEGERVMRARALVAADGARSRIAARHVPGAKELRSVFAYHEIVETPDGFDGSRCDVVYQGQVSPDFYGWVFPHGASTSVGVGTAVKGFSLRQATADLRRRSGLGDARTIRREGAPLPLEPLRRWDDGRGVLLAGDAAGVVAPASGEGIFYAMLGGRLAAEAVGERLTTGDGRALAMARRRFMKAHGRVFWVLSVMQWFWYRNDSMRERFVSICRDPDVQRLTWESYMNKELVRREPLAHLRIFFKDLAHLLRLTSP